MNTTVVWLVQENSDNASPSFFYEDLDLAKRKCEDLARGPHGFGIEPFHWKHDQDDDTWWLHDADDFPLYVAYKFTKYELPEGIEWRVAGFDFTEKGGE